MTRGTGDGINEKARKNSYGKDIKKNENGGKTVPGGTLTVIWVSFLFLGFILWWLVEVADLQTGFYNNKKEHTWARRQLSDTKTGTDDNGITRWTDLDSITDINEFRFRLVIFITFFFVC
jgi:hypothetical protein